MKVILAITLCYLLCLYVKPLWKSFLLGAAIYIIISFFILTVTAPSESKLNITFTSMSYFAGDALAEFIAYFVIALVIFSIFNRKEKQVPDAIDDSALNENDKNLIR